MPGVGSKSQAGSPSTQSCFAIGSPLRATTGAPISIDHSRPQSLPGAPPPGMRSAGGTSWQSAVHASPGAPLAGPSSHCSPHSTVPLPHSRRQVAEQPSHGVVLPSSHSSPSSLTPLPQTAGFGSQVSVIGLLPMRCPAVSVALASTTRRAIRLGRWGTTNGRSGVQTLRAVTGTPLCRIVEPALTVGPSASSAGTSRPRFATSVASAGLSGGA